MLRSNTLRRLCKRRIRIGHRTVSIGVLVAVGGGLLLSGGAVYARLGGFANDPTTDINLQKGLTGWWKLDGDLKDATPYQRNGTLAGATYTADRKGTASKAVSLNGTSQYITTASSGVTDNFTYSGWFNMNSFGIGWGGIFSSFNHLAPPSGINFIPRSGLIVVCAGDGTGTYSAATNCNMSYSASAVQLNTWVHGALTYDGTTLRVYVNGQNIGNTARTVSHSGASFIIGRWATSYGGYYASGSIDDVRAYNRALSGNEVTALYRQYDAQINAGSGQKDLLGWWKLDGSGKDNTPYQNTGVITSGTAIADRMNTTGAAYSFNAASSKMTLTNPVGGAGIMTASVWYRRNETTASSTWRTILGHKTANIHPLILNATSRNLGIWDGAFRDFGYNVPNDNSWHNFTVIYSSAGTAQLYVDGSYINQVVTTLNLGTNPIGMVGNWSGGNYWAGDVDDVRIYNRGLSTTEISQIVKSYNSQINLNSSPSVAMGTNISTGLVADWGFNGNAKDSTPYSNNAAVNGPALTADRRGRANSAYSFNGTSDYMNCGTSSILRPSTAITISAWVYMTGYSTALSGIVNYGAGGYWLSVGSNGIPYLYITSNTAVNAVSVIPLNQWRHIVATYDGSTGKIYINGSLNNSQTWTGAISSYALNCFIGSNKAVAGRYFQGSLDDVRIYNRALSSSEVQSLFIQYR